MAEIRTLKLNLLADVNNFTKGLKGAQGASKTFAGQIGLHMRQAAKWMAATTVAAGYLAVRMGTDMVKAAMEDEASQVRLAKTLQKTVRANSTLTKSVEDYIRIQQISKGFSDSELRASFGRLVASTHNVAKAQQLVNLAQDVSRGTGKDLETVTMALGKAYDGNLGALKRLGIPLDENVVKTKNVQAALKSLTDLYGGQASAYAGTFAGKMATLKQTIDEFKESIGTKLIDKLQGLLPVIKTVFDQLAGNKTDSMYEAMESVRRGRKTTQGGAMALGSSLESLATSFGNLFKALVGNDAGDATSRLNTLAAALQKVANAINAVASAWDKTRGLREAGVNIVSWFNRNIAFPGRAMGGPVAAGNPYLVGERGPELFIPSSNGSIRPNNALGGTTVININGVVDAESARRSIERILAQSARRTGPINLAGAFG